MSVLESIIGLSLSLSLALLCILLLLFCIIEINLKYLTYNSMICYHSSSNREQCESQWRKQVQIITNSSNSMWRLKSKRTLKYDKISVIAKVEWNYCQAILGNLLKPASLNKLCSRNLSDSIVLDTYYE